VSSRHRWRRVVAPEDGRSLLDAIAAGDLDDRLGAIAAAVEARRRLLLTVRSATALAALCVGDVVRITEQISPRYLAGLHGMVVGLDDHAATVRLKHPIGRFASGRVRCPPLTLEKLPTAESVPAVRNSRALGDRLDAGVDPQALGLFGILAGEPGEL
jgi:hypothetical protein